MEVEQLLFPLSGGLKWPFQCMPQIAAPHRRGERTDLESTPRSSLHQIWRVLLGGHCQFTARRLQGTREDSPVFRPEVGIVNDT